MSTHDLEPYHELHRRGLTTSLRHFSRHWLCAADNYACSRAERGLSAEAVRTLCHRLWSEGHYLLALRIGWSFIRSESTVWPEARR